MMDVVMVTMTRPDGTLCLVREEDVPEFTTRGFISHAVGQTSKEAATAITEDVIQPFIAPDLKTRKPRTRK